MPEEPENPEEPKPVELESLFGGLDLTPDWAKGDPGVKQTQPEFRSRDQNNRGREGGRPRAPKSSRPNMQGVRVKPRRSASGGDSRSNDSNRDNREGGHREGGYQGRPRNEERAPRVPVHVDFIPEKKRLSKVVKIIRQSHRAYPLKVVAEKFMENPSFISMKYTVKDLGEGQEDFHLYVCTANGMVFSDRQSCEQYVLDHGLAITYECEEREVDPPAGNFVCVGRHSRSGRLVGPSNWHGYQAQLEVLRSEIAEGVPMEAFMRGIEMVHDEELIDTWKKEISVKRFYRKKLEAKPVEPEVKAEAKPAEPEVKAEAKPESDPEAQAEPNLEAEASASSEPQEASENPTDPTVSAEESTVASEAEPEAEAEETPVVDDRPYDLTRDQAEADFRDNYLPKLVRKTKRAIMPGYLLDKMTDPGLLSMTRFHLNREHDRPNSIVFALRPAFKHMRLQVFRHHGQLLVSGIPQHPFPDDLKVVPEIRSILDHVAANPGCNTQEALKSVGEKEEIPAELISHFRWLIEKGHLLEMHDDTLQLPIVSKSNPPRANKPRPKDPKPKDPKSKEPEPKEPKLKEPDPKEPAPKDPAPKDPAPKDPEPKEPEPKEPEPKEPEPKEPEPKEPEPKDPEPKEPEPKEPEPKDPEPKDLG